MQMPKQVRQHQKLEKFVGTWVGEETTHPAPWCPEGATSTGTMKCKMALDGWFLHMDYTKKHGRKVGFKGKGMIGYDQTEKCYSMAWFDTMGGSADHGPRKGQKSSRSRTSAPWVRRGCPTPSPGTATSCSPWSTPMVRTGSS